MKVKGATLLTSGMDLPKRKKCEALKPHTFRDLEPQCQTAPELSALRHFQKASV